MQTVHMLIKFIGQRPAKFPLSTMLGSSLTQSPFIFLFAFLLTKRRHQHLPLLFSSQHLGQMYNSPGNNPLQPLTVEKRKLKLRTSWLTRCHLQQPHQNTPVQPGGGPPANTSVNACLKALSTSPKDRGGGRDHRWKPFHPC